MSELYRHLLIPPDPFFAPALNAMADFFDRLSALGGLPREAQFIAVVDTGKTRAIAQDARTGEEYHGPDLDIRRYSDPQSALHAMNGRDVNELWAQGAGPAAIPPFELFAARRPELRHSGSYPFAVRCKWRGEITCFLRPVLGSKHATDLREKAVFENP